MTKEKEEFIISKFDGKDFQYWKACCELVLCSKGLGDLISSPLPVEADDAKKEALTKRDCKARTVIIRSVDRAVGGLIIGCKTAYEMWKKLNSTYGKMNEVSKYALINKWSCYKMEGSQSIAQHIAEVEQMVRELEDMGEKVSESAVISKILYSLPEKYNSAITAWSTVEESKQKLSFLTEFLVHEETLLSKSSGQVVSDNIALVSKNGKYQKSTGSKGKDNKWKAKQKFPCRICRKKGHWANECPSKSKENVSLVSVKCFSAVSDSNVWIADSASTDHICKRLDWFVEYREYPDDSYKIHGLSGSSAVKGIGTVELNSRVNNKVVPITLKNVLYVPSAPYNLFSKMKGFKYGVTYIWNDRKNDILHVVNRKDNTIMAVGSVLDNTDLIALQFEHKEKKSFSVITKPNIQVWHERMGHVSKDKLRQMRKDNSVAGLDFEDNNTFCKGCALSKVPKSSFKSCDELKTTKAGELVFMDLCSASPSVSLKGAKYFLLFKDDFTKYQKVYFLKEKSQSAFYIRQFVAEVKNELGDNIRRIRTDNAKEFISKEVTDFLNKEGILMEFSSPRCPQQIGSVERENRTLIEDARSILQSSGMPDTIWAEAVNTSCYTRNFVVVGKRGKSSYELWHKSKPDISHLRIFGSTCYAVIPERGRRKFGPKTKVGYVVGYEWKCKSYRVFYPDRKGVFIEKHVRIDEDNIFNSAKKERQAAVMNVVDSDSSESECEYETANIKSKVVKKDNFGDSKLDIEPVVELEDISGSIGKSSNESKEEVRLSTRTDRREGLRVNPKATEHYQAGHCYFNSYDESEPSSYEEAIACQHKDKWLKAIDEELTSLEKNHTWVMVNLPKDRKPIKSMWIFKLKRKPNGETERYKARLVVKGCHQKYGEDYDEIYSPVAQFDSIRTLISVVAANDLEMIQFDIKTAFLNGDLDHEIYMIPPEGYVCKSNKVCLLKKALYGLKQAPRQWNQKLNDILTDYGLECSQSDYCLYLDKRENPSLIIAIYVDDGLCVSKSKSMLSEFMSYLKQRLDLRIINNECFIGIELKRLRAEEEIVIHQRSYTERLLKEYKMEDCNGSEIPAAPSVKLSRNNDGESDQLENGYRYRQLIGSLMYLSTRTRPDISYIVSKLAQYVECPLQIHWKAAQKVLKYLKATKSFGICYSRYGKTDEIKAYSDADFAGDVDNRKSTSGSVIILNGGSIIWTSHRQKCVATSTTEAEYVACCLCAKDAIWLTRLLKEIGSQHMSPAKIFCDNQPAVRMIHSTEMLRRTRHIEVSLHFVRDIVKCHEIEVEHISSENQVADILIKPLALKTFVKHRRSLGISNIQNN